MTIGKVLLIMAIIVFAFAAVGFSSPFNLIAVGLCFGFAGLLVG